MYMTFVGKSASVVEMKEEETFVHFIQRSENLAGTLKKSCRTKFTAVALFLPHSSKATRLSFLNHNMRTRNMESLSDMGWNGRTKSSEHFLRIR